MLITYITIQLITIIFAFAGLYLAVRIYTGGKKTDDSVLRAKAFLNTSFLKDSRALLLLMCIFFILHAAAELTEMVGVYMAGISTMLIKEATELGILASTVILAYKWSKLINPAKP